MRTLLMALLAAGCPSPEPSEEKPTEDSAFVVDYPDLDGDGFYPSEGDCDDTDGGVHPGATETCNGIDDDCDAEVDEGVTSTFYADADGDGFGDAASAADYCAPPEGYVPYGTDCNDADDAAFPGATELCNGVDDNCDGQVDEGLTTTWYADADGDGYGDPATGAEHCERPAGSTLDDGDCDDTNPAAFPGSDEVCDEADNDCDGAVDEGVTTLFYIDLDGDGFGSADTAEAACAQPTGYAATASDCNDIDPDVNPGAAEVCNGLDDDCDGMTDDATAVDASAWYDDADGDGYGDPGAATTACEAPLGSVADASDCDDTLASVNPAATEVCNGYDDDCDGTADGASATDLGTWYLDYDGDGRGGSRFSTASCDAPVGYVASSDDCDDTDASSYPGGTEVCDDADNDCDGTADDGLATFDWYADVDGDGFGDLADTETDCDAPAGYVADGTDCDDTDSGVNPGERETCDGVDEDCDGLIDEGLLGFSAACPAEDCVEVLDSDPGNASGTYVLDPGTYYCDMSTDGGGWTRVKNNLTVWGTGYDTSYYNTEGFTWNEALFAYDSGSVVAHCTYPDSLTGCNNLGFQFASEDWGVPLNWGSTTCGLATTSYEAATSYVGGYDFSIARASSTDTIRLGTLEAISNCTTWDNPGTAYVDVLVRR